MCGIFGVVAKSGGGHESSFISRSIGILAKHAQSRGRDSSGLVFRDDRRGEYQIFKGAIPLERLRGKTEVREYLNRLLRSYSAGDLETFAMMGHSRLVTNGSQFHQDNNQPVIKSGIIGVHNGIIVNDERLWERHPQIDRDYDIDTEVMLALIRHRLRNGQGVPAAMAETEAEVEGTVSTALFFADLPVLLLGTNNGSLYTLSNRRDLFCFASEFHPLDVLARKMGLDVPSEFEIHQMGSWRGLTVTLGEFAIEPFDFREVRNERGSGRVASEAEEFGTRETAIGDSGGQAELVLDVAAIASAPEASRQEALLEYNRDRISNLRRCSKCVLPETFPFIEFDEAGVCNYCRHYRLKNQPKPIEELERLLEPYRDDGEPDCIVPFSGGRDSTFALHTIKTRLGLNPIAYTYDWGMVTDLGRRNIARVCGKLGVENIIVAADIHKKREYIRKNIMAWLRKPHLGMVPLFMAGDKYFYYYVDQVKRQTGIKLNIWGINPMENTDFKVGFMGVPPDHEKDRIYALSLGRVLRLFTGVTGAVITNPAYLNSSVWNTLGGFIARSVMPHRDYFHLYDYVRWDEEKIEALLLEEYEWETAIDTDTTWRIGDGTAAFYNYIYYTTAGFSEHDTFRSNQIREGMITREEALRRVDEENRPRYPNIRWYTDVVKVDYEYAIRTINEIPKLYP